VRFWSDNADTGRFGEPLHAAARRTVRRAVVRGDRQRVVAALMYLQGRYPKLKMPEG
jgi:hypothetical protein